ncbi:MAG: hypothetical protein QOG45_1251 [Chloroflexota bacterium]|nr:hypothetical protein [Chloroflexota bacterium]
MVAAGAVETEMGSDQEGAAGLEGTAPAGSHAPAAPDAGDEGPAAGAWGTAGVEGGAAVLGRAAPHFQQATAALFEPQLWQVHRSIRASPRLGRRPSGRVLAPVPRKATPRCRGSVSGYTGNFSRAYSMESASAAQEASMMLGEHPTVLHRRPSRMSPDSMSTRVTAWVPAASSRMRTL